MRDALAALTGACFVLSCATTTKEQGLVNKAADAMGGVQALSGIKTSTSTSSVKYWEPEESDVTGGEPRFAAEAKVQTTTDRASRTVRADYEKNFAYPSA